MIVDEAGGLHVCVHDRAAHELEAALLQILAQRVGYRRRGRHVGVAPEDVASILAEAKAATTRLLSDHRYLVEALRDALLEREELVEAEILEILHLAEADAVASGRIIVDLTDPTVRVTAPRHYIELESEIPGSGL